MRKTRSRVVFCYESEEMDPNVILAIIFSMISRKYSVPNFFIFLQVKVRVRVRVILKKRIELKLLSNELNQNLLRQLLETNYFEGF
jgi:hypothetical protein